MNPVPGSGLSRTTESLAPNGHLARAYLKEGT